MKGRGRQQLCPGCSSLAVRSYATQKTVARAPGRRRYRFWSDPAHQRSFLEQLATALAVRQVGRDVCVEFLLMEHISLQIGTKSLEMMCCDLEGEGYFIIILRLNLHCALSTPTSHGIRLVLQKRANCATDFGRMRPGKEKC